MRLSFCRSAGTLLLTASLLAGPAFAETLKGSASYRERIAVPPGTTFEAVLEDVSAADAPAVELGSATIEDAGNPPYEFTIAYDGARILPSHLYSVRARLIGPDGRLIFTTDTFAPVLTGGAPEGVTLLMHPVSGIGEQAGARDPSTPMPEPEAVTLDLPASFEGTLPCADCEGIRYHLDLWPGNVFHLRREWLGVAHPQTQDHLGRWDMEPTRSVLTLFGSGEPPLKWMMIGSHSLRLLDSEGQVIVSDLPYEITGDGTLTPTSLSLQLDGEFRYMADAADFTICTTGETVPVLMEGDFVTAEDAYSKTRAEPGGPVAMLVDGTLAMRTGMEGPERMSLVIDHFVSASPSKTCAHRQAAAPLINTYWKLVRLNGKAVSVPEGGREPHLIFQAGVAPRLSATAGCNQFGGTYAVDGDTVSFGPLAGTLMACPEPLDALERALVKLLAAPRQWRIAGQTLTLRDGDTVLAEFEAQYLP